MKSRQREIIEGLVRENKPKPLMELMKLWQLSGIVNEYYQDCPKLHIRHKIKSGKEVCYEILNRSGRTIKKVEL